MASSGLGRGSLLLAVCLLLVLLPGRAAAFGAGNIPSIAQVEGVNWRHGDIEDMLKTIAFLKGKKWTSMLVSRVYFGNWLRDYSQAVDVGSLKGVNAPTIRILVWVLSFMAFGYATEEFEVTEERLGVYRPEEHIDNPLGYADGMDARKFDPRLRGPVDPVETKIDPRTGMKNYIANESGGWATSAGYLRFSFARSIHYGRVYTNGSRGSGKEDDLCEALRCLGQALHCMEDFSAHSNYCELALRELGYHQVYPHCGAATEIDLHGRRVFPLVTGTFGAVDFLHSVLGEATDHFTQSEVDEMNVALQNAEGMTANIGGGSSGGSSSGLGGIPGLGSLGNLAGLGGNSSSGSRGLFGLGSSSSSSNKSNDFISLVDQLPGIGGGLAKQAKELQARSAEQERDNQNVGNYSSSRGDLSRDSANQVPGMSTNFDPVKTAKNIYPILQFRDKIVKSISNLISKVPGLEKLLDHISETLTAFILGLLAPFVRPIINQVSKVLKDGSSTVISASSNSQLEPWKNPSCDDPTHSMLSKDHFTNILNSCAGRVAATVLQYVVPRVLYAWENPGVPVDEVVNDVLRAFHHPAIRDERIEIQRSMFETVRKWVDESSHKHELSHLLSSESVKAGKNHILSGEASRGHEGPGHSHGAWDSFGELGHGKNKGSLWSQIRTRDLNSMDGDDRKPLSSSPLPPQNTNYGYDQDNRASSQPYPSGGYESSQGHASGYYSQPEPQGYGHHQPPPPPQGQWGPPQPPQGYGGPGYGGPGYGGPPPGQYPPYQQPHHPHHPQGGGGGGWGQYPGQHRY
ncbi:heterokaryon incompatibility protein het-c [Colletotrichum kahawae]|uniref:Heterokaryon incompatibility protein het-c n=1 Tax=Colletotrichum kahawae TaxID=34407 RepID=A0AAD9YQ07_COLKA|nr:heterokaryon incompatibility protein het-c [Colletotrichum kahawae]